MTNEEFDNMTFKKGDKIEVRHYFKIEVENVEYVNIVDRYKPLCKCYDCIYWHPNTEKRKDFAVDFSSGSCDHNGYSKVPPMFTCNGWASGEGIVFDKCKKY